MHRKSTHAKKRQTLTHIITKYQDRPGSYQLIFKNLNLSTHGGKFARLLLGLHCCANSHCSCFQCENFRHGEICNHHFIANFSREYGDW